MAGKRARKTDARVKAATSSASTASSASASTTTPRSRSNGSGRVAGDDYARRQRSASAAGPRNVFTPQLGRDGCVRTRKRRPMAIAIRHSAVDSSRRVVKVAKAKGAGRVAGEGAASRRQVIRLWHARSGDGRGGEGEREGRSSRSVRHIIARSLKKAGRRVSTGVEMRGGGRRNGEN